MYLSSSYALPKPLNEQSQTIPPLHSPILAISGMKLFENSGVLSTRCLCTSDKVTSNILRSKRETSVYILTLLAIELVLIHIIFDWHKYYKSLNKTTCTHSEKNRGSNERATKTNCIEHKGVASLPTFQEVVCFYFESVHRAVHSADPSREPTETPNGKNHYCHAWLDGCNNFLEFYDRRIEKGWTCNYSNFIQWERGAKKSSPAQGN